MHLALAIRASLGQPGPSFARYLSRKVPGKDLRAASRNVFPAFVQETVEVRLVCGIAFGLSGDNLCEHAFHALEPARLGEFSQLLLGQFRDFDLHE